MNLIPKTYNLNPVKLPLALFNRVNLKIVFMGTPQFGAIILEELIKKNYKPCLVVTVPDTPVGRKRILTPPPVKILAERYKISVAQPEKILNLKSEILNLKPDLIIVAAYGQILPEEILEIPRKGSLNVHPSLLPKYRGSTPVQFAILNGDEETGVTIILMDAQMDHGPIISQRKTEIGPNETGKQLQERLAILGAELLIDTIPDWIRGEIKLSLQNEKKVTYTKILTKEDGKIDWKKSALEIEQKIRAFSFWPGSYTFWHKNNKAQRIKILKVRTLKTVDAKTYPIGKTLVAPQNELCVRCGKGFLIIEKLQLEGRKEMGSEKFLRGYPDFIGTILE